jgi:hypothetical protein
MTLVASDSLACLCPPISTHLTRSGADRVPLLMSGESASANLSLPPDQRSCLGHLHFDTWRNGTYVWFSMATYKRNQVEQAISRTIGERSEKPSSGLRIRLKRLQEADRKLGRDPCSNDPEAERFAF